jgi:probable phosphoglycerate mutase
MAIIYIARHGETEYNATGKLQGHNDSPLTIKGVKQAKDLGLKIEGIKFDKVISSDLGRAFITTYLALTEAKHNNLIHTDSRLRELNYGIYNGSPIPGMKELNSGLVTADSFKAFPHYLDNKNVPYQDGESFEDLIARLTDFWQQEAADDLTKLFVAHSGTVRGLLNIAGVDRFQVKEERMPNAFLVRITIENNTLTDYQEL